MNRGSLPRGLGRSILWKLTYISITNGKFNLKLEIHEMILILKKLITHFWMEMFLASVLYDVYISQLFCFSRVRPNAIELLIAKLLKS